MAMSLVPELPNPKDWGWWKDDRGWHPLWTTLPEASESCRELWMQERMHYEVHMCQRCPKMYSPMLLLWRMLKYLLLFIYTFVLYILMIIKIHKRV